jgi:hypothetical protein
MLRGSHRVPVGRLLVDELRARAKAWLLRIVLGGWVDNPILLLNWLWVKTLVPSDLKIAGK